MNDDNSDKKLVNFLKQYRPNSPEAAPDLEQKLLAALERDEADRPKLAWSESQLDRPEKRLRISSIAKWTFPPAIAAGLLVSWSAYRLLVPAPINQDETAKLEAFLINNWEGVANCYSGEIAGDRAQTDWLNIAVTADTEQAKNH